MCRLRCSFDDYHADSFAESQSIILVIRLEDQEPQTQGPQHMVMPPGPNRSADVFDIMETPD